MRIASLGRFLLFTTVVVALSAASFAQVGIGISVNFGPPALPVYEQPPCPAVGYIWTPGYWAWDPDSGDYYWVPGTWVLAPEVGFLWTPAWWGWSSGVYLFHEGYWGPHVGFYGGIAYGYGYFGHGYEGGRWEGGQFFYNRSVNNVNITNIHNVYNTTVINNTTVNRVSYNGGPGGIQERPRTEELQAEHERHLQPAPVQRQQEQVARTEPQQRASVNQGRPAIAATPRPGALREPGAVPAKEAGAPYHPPANRGGTEAGRPANNNVPRPENRANEPAARPENAARAANNVPRPPANHASELQPHERPPAPNTGNPKLDQKYQQQQDKLIQRQNQQHQQLQQKQEQEHQRLAQQHANDARQQQVEQRHQQQTQQLEQKHVQQQQHLQQKQQPPRPPGK
jgi:WXXGXW repeat (2 copies)